MIREIQVTILWNDLDKLSLKECKENLIDELIYNGYTIKSEKE